MNIKENLNKLYSREVNGIYQPYQPIYGQRCKAYPKSFVITYNILYELSKLKFNSVLDVGCAEGYTAYRIRQLFDVRVYGCDYSPIACKRAKDIFNIPTREADARELPYEDNAFDVVICSETLEHMYEYQKAYLELMRVARKSVIITVPFQSEKDLSYHKLRASGHRARFHRNSFGKGRAISSRLTRLLGRFTNNPNIILLDRFLPFHDTLIFVIHKNRLSPKWVIDFKVKEHYI